MIDSPMLPIVAITVLSLSVMLGFAGGQVVRLYASPSRKELLVLYVASVLLAAWAISVFAPIWLLCVTVLLGSSLLVLGMIDALVFRLPDAITLPLAVVGLVASYFLPDRDVIGHAIGAAIAFLVFLAVMVGFQRVRKRDGLGLGDAKLAAAAGAWLGWEALPYVVLIACCGGFIWVGLAVCRNGRSALQQHIPFGVPLCLAIWILWICGVPSPQGWP